MLDSPAQPASREPGSRGRYRYRVFGLDLASDFPFAGHHVAAVSEAELRLDSEPPEDLAEELAGSTPIFSSPCLTQTGESLATLHRLEGCEVLRFGAESDFYLLDRRIVCHSRVPEQPWLREIRLLGPVFAYWLERAGLAALHASAVEVGRGAVAFLSSSRGGKSSLAAAMVRSGRRLLSDDILAVSLSEGRLLGRPGYPQMRMWPAEADFFLGGHQDLERIHPDFTKRRVPVKPSFFGDFCDTSLPLAAIFLPERREPDPGGARGNLEIELEPVPGREAVIEMVRHSFSPHIVAAAGLQPGRLELFGRIAERVPVRRLRYPSGLEHLEQICEAVVDSLLE